MAGVSYFTVFLCCTGSFQTIQIEKGSPFRFVSALEEEQRLEGPWEEENLTVRWEILHKSMLCW